MISRVIFGTAALCAVAHAGVRSGKATADLLTASQTYQAGQPLQVAVRLKIDLPWHTYWSNPGEGGMKIGVKWQLPEGWTASEPAHPFPKAFSTGGLAGYGYEGTAVFPITLTPPENASGEVKPTAKISWLTCNDDACVPGSAEISLSLKQGEAEKTADSAEIQAALAKVPQPSGDYALTVKEEGKNLSFSLKAPESADLKDVKVFPETEQAVDPAAKIVFVKSGDSWTASAAKNEYASEPLKTLTLIIGTPEPVQVTWKAENF